MALIWRRLISRILGKHRNDSASSSQQIIAALHPPHKRMPETYIMSNNIKIRFVSYSLYKSERWQPPSSETPILIEQPVVKSDIQVEKDHTTTPRIQFLSYQEVKHTTNVEEVG